MKLMRRFEEGMVVLFCVRLRFLVTFTVQLRELVNARKGNETAAGSKRCQMNGTWDVRGRLMGR